MSRVLTLYANFTPNKDKNTHFYFATPNEYLTKLNTLTHIEITLDNYRINSGIIKVSKNAVSGFDVKNATYAVDMEKGTNPKIYKCYHIRSYEELDFFVFEVDVDLWGTYICFAYLSRINVLRCNRKIGVGVYDEVENTNGGTNIEYMRPRLDNGWLDDTNHYGYDKYISVLFVVEFNVKEQVFGDDHISITKMFGATLQELRDVAHTDYASEAGVTIASDILGGIHAVVGNIGTLDARVIKAWVLPNVLFSYGETNVTFKTKSLYTGGTDKNLQVWEVLPKRDSLSFYQIPMELNKAIYFGCYNYGLKLKRYTNDYLEAIIVANIGVIDLSIIVKQGEEQKDITQAFEMPLTTNSSVTTTLRQIAKAFSLSVGAERNLVKDFSQGGPAQAGLGFANTIAGMVNLTPRIDKAIGGGDATDTYYSKHTITSGDETKHCSLNPFVVSSFDSVRDEEKHARLFGATFNEIIDDITSIENYDLLGVGTLDDTYVVANLRASEIPQEAKDFIQNAFANGVYIQFL